MDRTYQKLIRLGIDLAPLGIERRTENIPYSCTPKGASILGWAGVDGIHYCRIRGFGDMVFAVSPMNAPRFVRPIAENFTSLLRLLLACGDAALLEQAWQWDAAQFEAARAEDPQTEEQKSVLQTLAAQFSLEPMPDPWQYVTNLQAAFDFSRIRYTEEIDDPDMNPDASWFPKEWKVFYGADFLARSANRQRPGKAVPIRKQFAWAGHTWVIPAVYVCSKGIVVDFCMQSDAGTNVHFEPQLEVNGKTLTAACSFGIVFSPEDDDPSEAAWVLEHYGLDQTTGWQITRAAFAWRSRKPAGIRSVSLTLIPLPVSVPGPHFCVHAPGDTVLLQDPTKETVYTLTVQAIERQTLPQTCFDAHECFYPTHFTAMRYAISPEPAVPFRIADCDEGDRPMPIAPPDPLQPEPSYAAVIGIIGGADGPTVLTLGNSDKACHTVCSALHFEPTDQDPEWQTVFYEQLYAVFQTALLPIDE